MQTPEPSKMRKYFYEYSIFSLVGAVVFLFYLYADLNKYIREDLTRQNVEQRETLHDVSETMKEIKSIIKNKQQ